MIAFSRQYSDELFATEEDRSESGLPQRRSYGPCGQSQTGVVMLEEERSAVAESAEPGIPAFDRRLSELRIRRGASGPEGTQSEDAASRPETLRLRSVTDRFHELLATWQEECKLLSSASQAAMHPAYQQIIGMGQDALSLIFQQMAETPDHWFWALRAITGENPVPPQDAGDVPRMTEIWLRWGRGHGYL